MYRFCTVPCGCRTKYRKYLVFFFAERKKTMNFYSDAKEAVLKDLSATEEGLSSAEAAARLEKYGKNKLKEGKKDGIVKMFLKQLADPMIIVLLVAAGLALLLTTAVIYVPFLKNLFGFTEISLAEYGMALALAILIIPAVELVKLFQRLAAKLRAKK